ncbi:hypothetical protein PINS_up009643 [Pythium insidiosum]|nr:hypothetical protein PINS_up009643 [Pythium insidiosum]
MTSLRLAIDAHDEALLEQSLLTLCADERDASERLDDALVFACEIGAADDVLSVLVAHGANVNAPATRLGGGTALHLAVERVSRGAHGRRRYGSCVDTVAWLLRHGADATELDIFGETALDAVQRRMRLARTPPDARATYEAIERLLLATTEK